MPGRADPAISQTEVVVQAIKRMIIDGELTAGARLPIEQDLARALSVSRGSLREGVRALSVMGVLETRQGAGTYVTSLDPAMLIAPMGFVVDLHRGGDAADLHAVRRYLETEAAGLAAQRIDGAGLAAAADVLDRMADAVAHAEIDHEAVLHYDIEFHRIIAEQAGNPALAALIAALSNQTLRGRLWRAISEDRAEQATLGEHRLVLAALSSGSVDAARVRMANHLLAVEEFLRDRPEED